MLEVYTVGSDRPEVLISVQSTAAHRDRDIVIRKVYKTETLFQLVTAMTYPSAFHG